MARDSEIAFDEQVLESADNRDAPEPRDDGRRRQPEDDSGVVDASWLSLVFAGSMYFFNHAPAAGAPPAGIAAHAPDYRLTLPGRLLASYSCCWAMSAAM